MRVLYGDNRETTIQDVVRLEQMLRKQARAFSTMAVLDIRFKAFPCSLVASAILYVSRRSLGLPIDAIWPDRLIDMTSYAVDDISIVVQLIDCTSQEISQWLIASNRSIAAPSQPALTTTVMTPEKIETHDHAAISKTAISLHSKTKVDETHSPASIADAAIHQTAINNSPKSAVHKNQQEVIL